MPLSYFLSYLPFLCVRLLLLFFSSFCVLLPLLSDDASIRAAVDGAASNGCADPAGQRTWYYCGPHHLPAKCAQFDPRRLCLHGARRAYLVDSKLPLRSFTQLTCMRHHLYVRHRICDKVMTRKEVIGCCWQLLSWLCHLHKWTQLGLPAG